MKEETSSVSSSQRLLRFSSLRLPRESLKTKEAQEGESYIVRTGDGVEFGPIPLSQVERLARQLKIKATTMIFMKSNQRWHLAASVPEVRTFVQKYNPDQQSILNRIRCIKRIHSRDGMHDIEGRPPEISIKLPFWKKIFSH